MCLNRVKALFYKGFVQTHFFLGVCIPVSGKTGFGLVWQGFPGVFGQTHLYFKVCLKVCLNVSEAVREVPSASDGELVFDGKAVLDGTDMSGHQTHFEKYFSRVCPGMCLAGFYIGDADGAEMDSTI